MKSETSRSIRGIIGGRVFSCVFTERKIAYLLHDVVLANKKVRVREWVGSGNYFIGLGSSLSAHRRQRGRKNLKKKKVEKKRPHYLLPNP